MNEEITLLFAVEAEQLLLSGFVEEAIDLLKKGIEKFPDYSAANAILAKAYTLLGKDDDANQTINNLKETNYFYSKIGFNSESANILNPDSLAPSIDFNENFEGNPTFQSFIDLPINENDISNDSKEQAEELINDFSNFNINNSNSKSEDFEEAKTTEEENLEIDDLLKSFDTAADSEEEKTIETENTEIEDLTESFDKNEIFEEVKTIADEHLEIEDLADSFNEEIIPKEENFIEIEDFEDDIKEEEKKEQIESDLNSDLDEIKGSNEFAEEENFIESNESDVIADSNFEIEVIENKDIEQNLESINTIESNVEENNILELSSLIEDFSICNDSEINLGFIDSSEKLFNQDCEEFDIDEFIKKNSIKKEKKDFSIPFIDEEMKRIPSLVHPFKNFVYKPIKISYTEHLKYIDKIFNLEDDKKIIGLHFLGKNISSELYAGEILHTNEKSDEKAILNENYSFASETIARIYRQQGAFKEAIAAYKELMISDPSKKEYYENEIAQMMES